MKMQEYWSCCTFRSDLKRNKVNSRTEFYPADLEGQGQYAMTSVHTYTEREGKKNKSQEGCAKLYIFIFKTD